jgi:beta-lactam-binding protein with PASTA domain
MSVEEQRLAQLLKRAVPEPPFELSADQVTMQRVDRSVKSWTLPAMAAAAVLAIGVTVGAIATHNSSRGAQGTSKSAASPATGSTNSASPQAKPSCQAQGHSVVVPSLVGQALAPATAIARQAGFTVEIDQAKSPTTQHVPPGVVFAQSPPAGTKTAPGTVLVVTVPGSGSGGTASPGATSASCQAHGRTSSAPGSVVVPSLVGQALASATAIARQAGFTVNVVQAKSASAQHVPQGTVFAQSPSAGSTAPREALLTIYVASS